MKSPFLVPAPPRWPVDEIEAVVVEDRLRALKTFDAQQCRNAIVYPGTQATVRKAAWSRLRRLEKEVES